MRKPRISCVDPAPLTDKAMLAEFERCVHHQIMAGGDASMAPGFAAAEAAMPTKQRSDYWVRRNVAAATRRPNGICSRHG
jgi:hypothetical protein